MSDILSPFGLSPNMGADHIVRSPIDGAELGRVAFTPADEIDSVVARATDAFHQWRRVPAPIRGEVIRLFGNE